MNALRSIVIITSMLLLAACAGTSSQYSDEYEPIPPGRGQSYEQDYREDPRQQQRRRPPQEDYDSVYEEPESARGSDPCETGERRDCFYVGVQVLKQNHVTDMIMQKCGRDTQRCGPELRSAAKAGKIEILRNEDVGMYFYRRGVKEPIEANGPHGYASTPVSPERVQGAQFCAEVRNWKAVAHQYRAPAKGVIGECGARVGEYLASGRGMNPRETYALTLIKAAY